ncbi:MAG: mechanosensitive ion channel [Alphaproteobacteria bacterium]|nr:mechanosensitive ion channel [Alphaproteobacteria bacterium]
MKRILLLIWAVILLMGAAIAAEIPLLMNVQKDASPQGLPSKPIKVSEINANLFSTIYDFLNDALSFLLEGFVSLKDFIETGEWLFTALKNPGMQDKMQAFGVRLIIAFFVALLISQGLSVWLRPKIHNLLLCKGQPSSTKLQRLFIAALLSMLSPLLFGFILYALFRFINPNDVVYLEIVRILSSGAVTIWILLNLANVFLKPISPEHQHIPLSQELLATTYGWIRLMASVALFGFFALEVGALIKLPISGERLLLQGTGFIIVIMAIFMMLALHQEVKEWIDEQRLDSKLSRLRRSLLAYLEYSYIPVIIFIVISYVSWVTHELDRFQVVVWKCLFTLALFPLLQIAAYCLRKIRILYINKHLSHLSYSFAKRALFYGRQLDFVTFTLLNATAVIVVLDLWGFNPSYFIFSNLGRLIAEKAFSIFTIIVVALFITRAGNGLLTKYLNAEKNSRDEAQKQRIARLRTLYSVSRNVLRIAIWTPAILLIIVELEVDVMPLLATVGILSVGLSFGVQSLVKDLVTGFFMLLEDAFAVGDLVVINGQMGRIESLTVRVVRLRATDGSLYTFPYGNITSLSNQNRDFSAAVMLFQVGVQADVDQVVEILDKISKDLRKDSLTRKLVMEPIEINGINEINDHALEFRAILKTKPSEHYKVKWAFNRLLKKYLEFYNIPPAIPRAVAYNYGVKE